MIKLLRIFTLFFLVSLTYITPLSTTAQSIPQLDLDVAEAQGLISYEARGRGYASGAMIDLTVTNLSDSPLDVVIPPGMRFVPVTTLQGAAYTVPGNQETLLKPFYAPIDTKQSRFFAANLQVSLIAFQGGGSQIGAVAQRHTMMFSGGSVNRPTELIRLQHETQSTILEAYCANAHLDNPSTSTVFRAVSPPNDDLTRLMSFYSDQNLTVSLIALQIATWIITDDVDMDFLISVGYGPTTEELYEALYLLQDAGIDVSNKQLGQTPLPPRLAPVPISPVDDSTTTNVQPTLTWRPVNGAVTYEVALDIVYGEPPPNIFMGYAVGTTFKPPAPLYPATYYWAVRAIYGSGTASPWSLTQSFTLLSTTNAAPVRTLYTTHQPTLVWNRVSWATAYQVEVSDTSNFTGYVIQSDVLSPQELSWVTDYLGNGTWFWHVHALKADGVTWGSWSNTETFLVLVP